ncbi:MAG TPA: hypothetical protein VMB50_08595, partial [Myxococcales bacterium]|nr:hypothetical protein [Myxococcales bacterium]
MKTAALTGLSVFFAACSSGPTQNGQCHETGESCALPADCCSGFSCIASECVFNGGNGGNNGNNGNSGGSSTGSNGTNAGGSNGGNCAAAGASCFLPSQCCSASCLSGHCAAGGTGTGGG